MNMRFLTRLALVVSMAAGGVMTSGCWTAHPHSAYRAIHRYAIDGDVVAAAAELAKFPDEINLPEDDGLTPLHLAAENCHTNVVTLLLDRGAAINVVANDKSSPLHLAAQEGCTEVVALLLERGAKSNERYDQKRTPLDRAELWHQDATAKILRQHGGVE